MMPYISDTSPTVTTSPYRTYDIDTHAATSEIEGFSKNFFELTRWWHWFICRTILWHKVQFWVYLPVNKIKPSFYRRAPSAISGFLGKAMKRRKGR